MTYIEMAQDLGYSGTAEKLESIGMAIELGAVAWSWYEVGDDKYGVAAIFAYRGDEPTEEATIGAYAEGAANDFD